MGRQKRSERVEAVKVKPAPVVAPPRVAERVVAALCPCCGRAIPQNRAIKIGSITVDRVPYFESIEWDENKPFGTSYLPAGRGSFHDWLPLKPEDAPELFEAVKKRFLDALGEWLRKGWLTREELEVK